MPRTLLLVALTAALLPASAPAEEESAPRFTGARVSLDVKDVDLHDFFRLIHEISGLNIVVDSAARGRPTLVLINVPWDQALDIVLTTHGLVSELEGNVLRILTRATAKREAEAKRELTRAREEAVPRRTLFYPLSYAKASEAAAILRRLLSPRGEIAVDERTNTLIITDVPAVLEKLVGNPGRFDEGEKPAPSEQPPQCD